MNGCRVIAIALCLAVAPGAAVRTFAQSDSQTVELTVTAGRPLRVALDQTVRLQHAGQPISATLIEPVYAYDRIVLPAGTKIRGHVAQVLSASKTARVRGALGGDFSVPRRVVLEFDTIVMTDGPSMAIETVVANGAERVRRQVAAGADASSKTGLVARAKQRVTNTVADLKAQRDEALSAIKGPGKMQRLKELILNRAPYHPQYLHQGTVYNAQLQAAISFGTVTAIARAPAGTSPAPDSVLTARLTTTLNSAKSTRGNVVEAVVTEPVFSADHQLILAEGATLEGDVTFVKAARRWHRNGQLRFLFERVQPTPDQTPSALLASLYSVDISRDQHVALDDEGGASVVNSKTRFIAPALAVMALNGSIEQDHHHFDNDGDAYDLGQVPATTSGHFGSRGLGGLFGFGLLGAALSQISRPVGVAFASVGAVRTVYKNVLGKGDELSFPADTPIQVRLAPGPTSDK